MGQEMTANIVAVGAINAALGLFSPEIIQQAVCSHIPKGTETLNENALAEGEKLVSAAERARFHRDVE